MTNTNPTLSFLSSDQKRNYLTGKLLEVVLSVEPAWIHPENRDAAFDRIDKLVDGLIGGVE
jgi:hypothetical protein